MDRALICVRNRSFSDNIPKITHSTSYVYLHCRTGECSPSNWISTIPSPSACHQRPDRCTPQGGRDLMRALFDINVLNCVVVSGNITYFINRLRDHMHISMSIIRNVPAVSGIRTSFTPWPTALMGFQSPGS